MFVILGLAGPGATLANADVPCPPPSNRIIYPPTLPNGSLGVAYSQQLFYSVSSGTFNWSISSGALPTGLTIKPSDGLISGIPTAIGTYNFTVRVDKVGSRISCSAARQYTIVIKAPSTTTLTVSANPVITGQPITLTAQVSVPGGVTPTGAVQFNVNSSPVGSAVPLSGGSAILNIPAPPGGSDSYFTATASYSGDGNVWPSSDGLSVSVYTYSVQDDAGNGLFFNYDGTYIFIHSAGGSNLVLKGKGTVLDSATGCSVILEHSAADRELMAESNPCEQSGIATMVYQGATYIITQGSSGSSSFRKRM